MIADRSRGAGSSADQRSDRKIAITELTFPDGSAQDHAANRVLVAGSGHAMDRVIETLARTEQRQLVIGVLGAASQPDFSRKHRGIPNLGGYSVIKSAILDYCVDEVHVISSLREGKDTVEQACQELGVPLVCHSEGGEAEAVSYRHPANYGVLRWIKRAFDIVVASTVLLVSLPLCLVVAALIKLTSRGPVFFRQQRIGQGRRCFGMWKFRTMLPNAEELRHEVAAMNNARGISFKVFHDPRVTRIGSLLRRSSLDELPQILNVLTGEMSLVGPRPIPVWVGEQLDEPEFFRRFCVKPGLTGLWQVEGREQDFDYMATQDLRYVDRWSLGLDLSILLRTLPAVVKGEGAH